MSTEEAREDSVDFMKEFFFIFLILSSDRVPPVAGTSYYECMFSLRECGIQCTLLMMFAHAQRAHKLNVMRHGFLYNTLSTLLVTSDE